MVSLGALLAPRGAVPAAEETNRPNVLFLAVDDLRPQLGCYGCPQMVTPHLDALAAGGTRFDGANCMVPVCGASRASLMTGLRPTRTRFVGWDCRADKDAPNAVPLNAHFTRHGYCTVSLGKVFHHMTDHADGWSEPPWRPNLPDRYCDCYVLPESLAAERRHREQAPRGPRARHRGPAYEAADVPDEAYSDGRTTQRALAELRRLAGKQQPFFLAVGFIRPHLPFLAPKRYWDLYDFEQIHLPANYHPPKNCPRAALHNWGELRAYAGIPQQGPLTDETARRLIHGYYACVSYVDAQVGKLLDELERLGLDEETIVIVWGDHGWNLGEHGLWCKHSCFETSMRAPLIVRAPGMPEGGERNLPVEFIDIYPSLCELAGLARPGHLHGTSFVPLLRGAETFAVGRAAVGRYGRGETIRTDRYRYTEYLTPDGRATDRMLYDHSDDPDETVNIAEQPDNEDVVDSLSRRLREVRVEADD
ncbi:MAG: sulfatase [Thermoguttaceae bacterium]